MTQVSEKQAQTMAEAAGLDLPAERLAALARTLSQFLNQFEVVRAIDKGDREPPTITWEREA